MTSHRPRTFRVIPGQTADVTERLERTYIQNRMPVLRVVLVGTGVFMAALLLLLLYSWLGLGNDQVKERVLVAAMAVGFIVFLRWLSLRASYRWAAFLTVLFYFLLAGGSVLAWGISVPFGILLLSLCIVLASTLISARSALITALAASLTVLFTVFSNQAGWIIPQQTVLRGHYGYGDALGHCVVFGIIAVVSWLFGRQMEASLTAAQEAEAALAQERSLLKVRIAERTAELKQVQLEEIRQLYHFAEAGQLSTALLHDLANYLTVLTVEIDGMRSKKHTEALERSRQVVSQLNGMLDNVRERLVGNPAPVAYNVANVISQTIARVRDQRLSPAVDIEWQPPTDIKPYAFTGEPMKLEQIITILLTNAREAYATLPPRSDGFRITLALDRHDGQSRITVTDWGIGITPANRKKIFKATYTAKRTGMGIGLYLARQMVVTEFGGSLELAPTNKYTQFIVRLPSQAGPRAKTSS